MNLIKKIKKQIKKISFIVKLKKKIWFLLKLDDKFHPIFNKEDYFLRIFEETPNFKSLSFNEGLVKGEFDKTTFFIKYHPKDIIGSQVYLKGLWEPHILNLISTYIKDNDGSVLDIGANIGVISIPLAKKFKDVNFFLFEPHPEIFKELDTNVSYNRLKNVNTFNVAISDIHNEYKTLYAAKDYENRGLSSLKINHDNKIYEKIDVKCFNIDKFFEQKNIKIDVIKIDTQGTELQILQSSRNTIKKNKPVIIFEFESEYFDSEEDLKNSKNQILEFFKTENYDLYMIDPNLSYFPKLNLNFYFRGEVLALPKFYESKKNNF